MIVQKYETKSFDEVNFEFEALLNRFATLERTVNEQILALQTADQVRDVLNDYQAQFVSVVNNAEKAQAGIETRMADMEVNHTALKGQIADTAEALKKAPQDVLADVIAAVDTAAEDAIISTP